MYIVRFFSQFYQQRIDTVFLGTAKRQCFWCTLVHQRGKSRITEATCDAPRLKVLRKYNISSLARLFWSLTLLPFTLPLSNHSFILDSFTCLVKSASSLPPFWLKTLTSKYVSILVLHFKDVLHRLIFYLANLQHMIFFEPVHQGKTFLRHFQFLKN